MDDDSLRLNVDNKEVTEALLNLAKRTENLRPLMKSIAGIFASSTEENFKQEGRPDKWTDLADITKKNREKINKWPGQILQVEGQLASSVTTQYDDDSAVIGSNKDYARIHQLGGDAGRGKKVKIPARPYLVLQDEDFEEILSECKKYLSDNG